ncbi:hypothetical protein B0H12DRAFT_1098875 [Mycena haematopus]|nr:hypothetical protein B0H12DRAFT_1098875 [Mycena haematopus]
MFCLGFLVLSLARALDSRKNPHRKNLKVYFPSVCRVTRPGFQCPRMAAAPHSKVTILQLQIRSEDGSVWSLS